MREATAEWASQGFPWVLGSCSVRDQCDPGHQVGACPFVGPADKCVTGHTLLPSPQSAPLSLPTQKPEVVACMNCLGPDFVQLHSAQSQSLSLFTFIAILDVLVLLDSPLYILFTTLSCCYLLFLRPFAIMKELFLSHVSPPGDSEGLQTQDLYSGMEVFPPVW